MTWPAIAHIRRKTKSDGILNSDALRRQFFQREENGPAACSESASVVK